MLRIQHTLCPKCNKMVPRAVGICILCGEVTEQATVPVEQPSIQKVAASPFLLKHQNQYQGHLKWYQVNQQLVSKLVA